MVGVSRRWVGGVVIAGLSGCFLDPSGAPSLAYSGEFNVTADGGFVMVGEVGFTTSAPASFDDVALCFYDDSGVVFHVEALGSMPPEREVSVTLDTVPEYIVVHSPDFYSEDVTYFYIEHLEADPEAEFGEEPIGHPSELPVDPRESGCGPS